MSKRPITTSHDYLINAALPKETDNGTVIPHAAIISKTKETLLQKGFEIERELYRCNDGAQIAQGIYHLKYGNDPDIGMLFVWVNSYDKSMRFKCSIGAYVNTSLASIVGGNMDTLSKKHTGSADQEVFDKIEEQITNAELYFNTLVNDKEAMKAIVVSAETKASFVGRIYFINDLISNEQLSIVKSEFKKPSFKYDGVEGSVWEMYNAIVFALQKAHPKSWMDQHKMIHYLLFKEYDKITPDFVKPEDSPLQKITNQLDLEDVIKEVEEEEKLKEKAALAEELILEQPGHLLDDIVLEKSPEIEEVIVQKEEAPWHDEPKVAFEDTASLNLGVSEPVLDNSAEDDNSWPCLSCGEMQGQTAIFYDGQLCNKCVNK